MRYSSFRVSTPASYSFIPDSWRYPRPPLSQLSKSLRARAEDSISQLQKAVSEFKNVCYANSLGSESMVLTDLIWGAVPEIDIFSIDTGRLYPETYDLIDRVQQRYGRTLTLYYPNAAELEGWVGKNGINGFRKRPRSAPGMLRHPQGGAVPPRHLRPQCLGDRHPARTIGQPRAGGTGRMGFYVQPAQGESAPRMVGKRDLGVHPQKAGCPTTPCTTAAFPASAARPARGRCNPARTNARADGGGNAVNHASAACIRAAR